MTVQRSKTRKVQDPTAASRRVVLAIEIIKWLFVTGWIAYGVLLLLVLNAQESWPVWTAAAGPVAFLACLVVAGGTWVVFGWLEQTLRMLNLIAQNTQPVPLGPVMNFMGTTEGTEPGESAGVVAPRHG